MTSGNFRTVAIDSIVVDRDARQRKELVGIEELADSISKVGLINPPVVDKNYVLVAGERRLTACLQLGWSHIAVQFAEDLPADELYLIELEENVKRVDLEWQDQVQAILNYHELRAKRETEWNGARTAKALGISTNECYNKLAVAKALNDGEPLVVNAEKYSVARGVVERMAAREKSAAVDMLKAKLENKPTPVAPAESIEEGDEPIVAEVPLISTPFIHADFREWITNYSGPKFNFLHCDFPYGVKADSHNQGAAGAFGGYEDSPDVYWELIATLAEATKTIVADEAHMMFWFSLDYYAETKARLDNMGWRVNPFPLVWHKSDNSGILPDPKRGPRRIYETAFLCSRGDRFVAQSVSNLFSAPNLKNIHMSEKNPDMLAHFFRMFVDKSTVMLDPTMGSGNAVRVAERMGAAHAVGLERDEEFFSRAVEAYVADLVPEV